ncbi:MAG: sugar transferase [Phenylobacterium sp.]
MRPGSTGAAMGTPKSIATYADAERSTIEPFARWSEVVPLVLTPVQTDRVEARAAVGGAYAGKRLIDAVFAGAALLLLAPLMALIWLLVVGTSAGPGLFWSQRIGRDGGIFWMPKYRTMTSGAPLSPREALEAAESHITPIGALLRRSALDELPQLFCVLTGEMSIIGPRPLLPQDPGVAARRRFPDALRARPGLSGLAQVVGRNSVSPRRKARLDALYAQSTSLALDAHIFWRTAGIVLTSRGFL